MEFENWKNIRSLNFASIRKTVNKKNVILVLKSNNPLKRY